MLALAALVGAAALGALGGCQQATTASVGVSFGTEGLMVVVVPALTEGVPMAPVTLPEAMGDDDLTYSVSPMVPGLSFNPSSRVLGGTPTVAGTYPVTYTATSPDDDKASLTFTVEVQSSLMGSWASSGRWEEDGQTVVWTQALTFTKSRYILHRTHYFLGDPVPESVWVLSGTWEATDTTITRIWLDDHDDNDETPEIERRVRKHYLWSEGRDVLCMQHWGDDREVLDEPVCDRYERMPNPAPADLLGTWKSDVLDEMWQWTIEITPTEFNATVENLYPDEGEDSFTLIGTYEVVPEELFLIVTVKDALEDGVSVLTNPDHPWEAGAWSRWAFAPTAIPNRLAVSHHWAETNPDSDGKGFVEGDDLPYGGYWLEVEKQ